MFHQLPSEFFPQILLLYNALYGTRGERSICFFISPYPGNVRLWHSCQVKKSYYQRVLHAYQYPCEGTSVFCFFCLFLEMDSKSILAGSVLISSLNLLTVYMHCGNVVRLLFLFPPPILYSYSDILTYLTW